MRNGLNMEIRKARKDDLNGIEKLLVQVNNLHVELRPDIFVANAVKYDEEKFDALISSDKTSVFVAVDDEGKLSVTYFAVFATTSKLRCTRISKRCLSTIYVLTKLRADKA